MPSLSQLFFKLKSARGIHLLFILFFSVLFIISRYPFYTYVPFPLPVVADGSEYYETYREMLTGAAHFDVITPGYPFFIGAVHELFSEKALALYFAQSVITLLAALLLLFSTFRYYRVCVPLLSIALSLFLCQDLTLRFETASFPQSLMIASSFVFLSFLMGVLNRPRWGNVALMCAAAVFLMLLKSSQMYMLPIIALVIGYLLVVRRKKIALRVAGFVFIPLFIYSGYNYFTIGDFTFIASGILKLDDNFRVFSKSEEALFYKIGENLPAWHPVYKIHHSSDLDTLQQAYLMSRWGTTLKKDTASGAMKLHVTFEMKETVNADSIVRNNPAFTVAEREWYFANKDSIEDQIINFYPRKLKRFKTYVLNYFFNIKMKSPLFYYSEVEWRYNNFFVTHAWASRYDLSNPEVKEKLSFLLREYYLPKGNIDEYHQRYNEMKNNFAFKLYDSFDLKIERPIAKNSFWAYAYFFLGVVAVLFYLARFRNPHLFFLLVLVLIHLGSCLLHAIWGDPLNRYSLATEFVPYFLLAFFPLFFMKRSPDQ